ncbi:MAG: PadR family transcriptional regulator [Gemmatimonas sp.]|nr:PadR family transcriptional regulator [Gemmatimonas sp.]
MSARSMELVKGTLDVLVLRTLAGAPMHGYAVSEWIRERTGGALEVRDGALYQALHRLEERGWVESAWGVSETNRRARYYELTPEGRAQLRAETATWRSYVDAVFQVLGPPSEDVG